MQLVLNQPCTKSTTNRTVATINEVTKHVTKQLQNSLFLVRKLKERFLALVASYVHTLAG